MPARWMSYQPVMSRTGNEGNLISHLELTRPGATTMPATCEYQYEAKISVKWIPVTEEFVCKKLAVEHPDARELKDVLIAMRRDGAEADAQDGKIIFRAVPVASEAGLRVAYTTADEAYDGFSTVTLVAVAGTDKRGRTVRKVGIQPEHYQWQTLRYMSGMHAAVEESEIERFADLWTMTE